MSKAQGKKADVLSPRHLLYCQEYVKDCNITQAAIRAGYTPRSAAQTGSRLMRNDKILKEIERLRGVTEKKLEISREAWLDQLWKIAFANITHIVEWDKKGRARYKSSDEIDGTLLKEFSETVGMNGVTKTLKLKDSMKAFELIGKAQGYFEKSKGDGNGNGLLEALVQAVNDSRERLDGGEDEDE